MAYVHHENHAKRCYVRRYFGLIKEPVIHETKIAKSTTTLIVACVQKEKKRNILKTKGKTTMTFLPHWVKEVRVVHEQSYLNGKKKVTQNRNSSQLLG